MGTLGMALEKPTLAEKGRRLEDFVDQFRDVLRRRDQRRWATVYLQGLLEPGGRKNIESISERASLPEELSAGNVSQALQNFVNHSPWDEGALLKRWRLAVALPLVTPESTLVIADLVFPKQGSHSVGVQRQHSFTLKRKINCQVAVSVHLAGPHHYMPLALRLYLPRGWCRQLERLQAAGIPLDQQAFLTRTELASRLLQQLKREGFGCLDVALGDEYNGESVQEIHRAGWNTVPLTDRDLARIRSECRRLKDDLGLDHFEGRSWRGFHHHACLVMLAFGFGANR